MWLEITVLVVVFCFVIFLVFWSAVFGYILYRIGNKIKDQTAELLATVPKMAATAEALRAAAEQWALVPKAIDGHTKVAKHMVVQYSKLVKAVDAFVGLVVEKHPSEAPPLIKHDEAEAAREFDIRELLEEHPEFERDQAEQLVDSATDYRNQALGVEG